jgi:hypothetical protein
MDTSIRVLVANRPRPLRELVLSTLSEQAGISVVGETDNEQDVPLLVAETKPDFLLIAFDEPQRRPALCDLLLREFPALRIIAVAPNINVGIYYWASFEIHSVTMEASEKALLERLRRKALPAREAWRETRGNVGVLGDVFECGSGLRSAGVKSTGKRRRRADSWGIRGTEFSRAGGVARQGNCGGQPGPRRGDGGANS